MATPPSGSSCLRRAGSGVFAELVEVAVGCAEIEPTVAVWTTLDLGHLGYPGRQQLFAGVGGVVDPQPGDGTGVELVVFHRVRPKQLESIPVCHCQLCKSFYIDRLVEPEDVGEEVAQGRTVVCGGTNPDDALDLHAVSSL